MKNTVCSVLTNDTLVKLQNCGVVEPDVFEEMATELYNRYMITVANSLRIVNKGFLASMFYSESAAKKDAELMFSNRIELLEHLICMNGKSKFIYLAKEDLDRFTIIHQAAIAAEYARRIIRCSRYSDKVIVDEECGINIDWLLSNSHILRSILIENGEGCNAKTE